MAKRRSIASIKKKRAKSAPSKVPTTRPTARASERHVSLIPKSPPKPRELLSTRTSGLITSRNCRFEQPTLKPRVKHVSQDTIKSKWTVLDKDVQAKVAKIFRSVELPVLARHASEQKKIEAQMALASVTRTLTRRLPKMPFPPRTKEVHFDYETLVKNNRTLLQQLTDSVKTSAELRAEVEKQNLALASERRDLEDLENNL